MVRALRRTNNQMKGSPEQAIQPGPDISVAALLGADFHGLHPALAVSEGDAVRTGDVLFHDRDRPEIAFVSPLSGTVGKIEIGARHTLSVLNIHRGQDDRNADPPQTTPETGDPRAMLLNRGFWPAFRTRPFAHIPDPAAQPDAIFVNALRTDPNAPDPRVVVQARPNQFQRGIEILTELTEGKIHICQPAGPDIIAASNGRVVISTFNDRRRFVQIGACIHKLFPARLGREIWTIGCQDVIAIGHLFETQNYLSDRVISLKFPDERQPRVFKTVLGASIADLIADFQVSSSPEASVRIFSGSPQSGREAAFIGRYHQQVTVIDAPKKHTKSPLRAPFEKSHVRQDIRPIIAVASLNKALPFDIPVVPLMRALSIGDVEAAENLGCLELIEEDVAPLSQICTSGADYGVLLRHMLDELGTVG